MDISEEDESDTLAPIPIPENGRLRLSQLQEDILNRQTTKSPSRLNQMGLGVSNDFFF